jgi:bifunctional DNase/RNase
MIEVRIVSVSADAGSGTPVVLLEALAPAEGTEPVTTHRMIPIWIGHPEANAILLAAQGIEFPRPMTHDLLRLVIETLGFIVERVEITRLEEGTFYAALILRGEERTVAVDARPSDCLVLATRVGCPVFVEDSIFDDASVLVRSVDEDDEEEEVERFRDFLDHVDPSDFMS